MFDSQIFLTVCSFLLGMFVGIRISAPLDDAIHEINTEPKDNGLLGRLIVENAQLRVRLEAQEVLICPECGSSFEN